MKDISGAEDIKFLVDSFYHKVQSDNLIGPFFNDVVKVDWDKHLPNMYVFCENAIFYTGGYKGNIIEKHQQVNQLSPLLQIHLERWLKLWKETVNQNFKGEKADEIIYRADAMGKIIFLKLS